MLYSKNGSYPATLPHRIKLSDGTTRTDSTTFTAEEIADAGYVAVSEAPSAEHPNKVQWTGSEWVVREPNDYEILTRRNEIKSHCLAMLDETDYKVIKAVELGEQIEQTYIDYRQELRNLYNSIDELDPWITEIPTLPDLAE